MEPTQLVLLGVSTVLGILGWSLRSQHSDAMKRIEKIEVANSVSSERLAKVETKQDAVADTLKEMREDIKAIREKVEEK